MCGPGVGLATASHPYTTAEGLPRGPRGTGIPYTGIVKTAIPLTAEQIELLCAFFEGVLDAMERHKGRILLRQVSGAPLTLSQRASLGRVWYKLRRHSKAQAAAQSGAHVAAKR